MRVILDIIIHFGYGISSACVFLIPYINVIASMSNES